MILEAALDGVCSLLIYSGLLSLGFHGTIFDGDGPLGILVLEVFCYTPTLAVASVVCTAYGQCWMETIVAVENWRSYGRDATAVSPLQSPLCWLMLNPLVIRLQWPSALV